MTPAQKAELIPLAIIAVGLALMVRFSGLKIWHLVVVLAVGIYLAATPPGQFVTTWINHMLAAFGH
jgi:hypothetical protein